jgi:hypothetical protein
MKLTLLFQLGQKKKKKKKKRGNDTSLSICISLENNISVTHLKK